MLLGRGKLNVGCEMSGCHEISDDVRYGFLGVLVLLLNVMDFWNLVHEVVL